MRSVADPLCGQIRYMGRLTIHCVTSIIYWVANPLRGQIRSSGRLTTRRGSVLSIFRSPPLAATFVFAARFATAFAPALASSFAATFATTFGTFVFGLVVVASAMRVIQADLALMTAR